MATDFDALLEDIEDGCTLHHYAAHAAATALARNWTAAKADGTPLPRVVRQDLVDVQTLLDGFFQTASAVPPGTDAGPRLDTILRELLAASTLHHFAAHDAAAILVENWKVAFHDGSTPERLAGADRKPTRELLAAFGKKAIEQADRPEPTIWISGVCRH